MNLQTKEVEQQNLCYSLFTLSYNLFLSDYLPLQSSTFPQVYCLILRLQCSPQIGCWTTYSLPKTHFKIPTSHFFIIFTPFNAFVC